MAFRSRCWRWGSPGPIRSPRSPTPRFKSIVSSSDDTQQTRLSSENDRSLNSFERASHAEPGYLADPARFRRARQLSELQRPPGDLARHRRKVRLGILEPCDAPGAVAFTWISCNRVRLPARNRCLSPECVVDRRLRILPNLPQMSLAAKALGINLVHIFRAGGPRREPSVLGDDLDAAKRLAVAGSGRERVEHGLAGQLRKPELFSRERLQQVLLG